MPRKTNIYANEDELLTEFARIMKSRADEALENGRNFLVGLSGGSMVPHFVKILPKISTNWCKWKFFFCDERVVPFDNSESTYGTYIKAIKNTNTDITENQFICINPNLSAEEAACDYINQMKVFFPNQKVPKFDVLLLGVGPDGHTCSLFPHHSLLEEDSVWVAPITDSPKPPPNRITFTYPVINNAQLCIFIVRNESKAEVVEKILKLQDKELPATLVQPENGDVLWMLDTEAASLIV